MTSGPRAAIFLNPAASRAHRGMAEATAILAQRFDLVIHRPVSAPELATAVRAELRAGCTLAIAAGGDGTVNIVVNALAGSSIPLGILPLGTANDLARQLGLPLDAAAAAARIVAGTIRPVDLLAVNGRRFCTVGGTGLVAYCAQSANRLRTGHSPLHACARSLGSTLYVLIAGWEILFRRRIVGCATLDDGPSAPIHGLFVANQSQLGAHLTLPVTSRNADGLLELCVLPAGRRRRLIASLIALRRGRPLPAGAMSVRSVRQVRIICDQEWPFLGDGEILAHGRVFDVAVLPAALAVVV